MIARYTRPELIRLWSDQFRFDTWLRVELAACEAMEAAGSVPAGTSVAVRAKAEGKLDPARILEHEERTRHDVIAFLTHVEELAGEPARWLHLGMTSSDVLDAALALQLVAATDQIVEGIDLLRAACRRRAQEHRATPAIGRSHGIHAEPITAGLVFAGFYAEVVRAQIVARDRHAALFQALARLGTAVERIAITVRHWQRTEVGEAMEAFGKGQKGSSAMPHKKNPILSENLCGIARLLRSYADTAMENVALWHERDISHSSVERVIGPDATGLCDFMVRRAAVLVDGLVVNAERMKRNLDLTGGLYFSEAVLLTLVRKGMARQAAYELVQRNALAAVAGKGSFRALLGADSDIAARLDARDIDRAFDLEHHLRHAGSIIDRALAEKDLP